MAPDEPDADGRAGRPLAAGDRAETRRAASIDEAAGVARAGHRRPFRPSLATDRAAAAASAVYLCVMTGRGARARGGGGGGGGSTPRAAAQRHPTPAAHLKSPPNASVARAVPRGGAEPIARRRARADTARLKRSVVGPPTNRRSHMRPMPAVGARAAFAARRPVGWREPWRDGAIPTETARQRRARRRAEGEPQCDGLPGAAEAARQERVLHPGAGTRLQLRMQHNVGDRIDQPRGAAPRARPRAAETLPPSAPPASLRARETQPHTATSIAPDPRVGARARARARPAASSRTSKVASARWPWLGVRGGAPARPKPIGTGTRTYGVEERARARSSRTDETAATGSRRAPRRRVEPIARRRDTERACVRAPASAR